MSAREPIPLRPDPAARARNALRTVARACLYAARNAGKTPSMIETKHPWADDARAIEWLTRSPVSPTSVAATSALAHVQVNFLPSLVPTSAAAAVIARTLQASFEGAVSISYPTLTLPFSGWVSEGQSIPVLQGTSGAGVTLSPYKLASILTLTNEMISAGNAENVLMQVLKENVGPTLDAVFFTNAAASAGLSPAGILNGAISVTATLGTASNPVASDIAKLEAALAPVSGAGNMVIVAAPAQASMIRSIIIDPPPVYTTNALAAGTVVGLVPEAIVSANSAPNVSASIETTLHMSTTPAELVTTPGVVASPQKSMFQTDSLALRFTMDTTWIKRGAGVAVCSGVNWP
jgi:hypothetical protein